MSEPTHEESEETAQETWLQKEIARKTAEAEERGDDFPIFSGIMNGIFGK